MATEYGSKEELGRYLQQQNPKYATLDPVELADKFMAKFPGAATIKEEPGFLSRAASDILPTANEEIRGLMESVRHPIDTAAYLGRLGVGALEMSDPSRAIRAMATQDPNAQMAQGVVEAIGQDLANAGQRPIRAAVDVASLVSPKAVGTAVGKARLLAKLGKAGRATYRAGQAAEALHRPVGAVGDVTRAAASSIGRKLGEASEVAYGDPGKGMSGARDAIVGFTTGTGERASKTMFEGITDPTFEREFRRGRDLSGAQASAQGGRAASDVLHEEILTGALKAYDDLGDQASMEYNRGIHRVPELRRTLKELEDQGVPLREVLRKNVASQLREMGFRVARKKGNAEVWSVREFDPARNALLPGDKEHLVSTASRLLNTSPRRTAGALHTYRQKLDQLITRTGRDPQGNMTQGGVAMTGLRNALHETMKDVIGGLNPEYGATLERYAAARSKLDLMAKEFGLRHGVIDAKGTIHEGKIDRGGALTKLLDSFTETADRRYIRPTLLKELEATGIPEAANLSAKILGPEYARMMASGLVGRGQLAGKFASLAAAPAVGFGTGGLPGLMAGLAMDIPIAMMYSPRLASTLFIKMAKVTNNPNPGAVRRAAAKMQTGYKRLLQGPSGPLVRAAMQEGWSVAKTLQVLKERGIDVEGTLNPEQQKARPAAAKPTMLKNLSRANPGNLAR